MPVAPGLLPAIIVAALAVLVVALVVTFAASASTLTAPAVSPPKLAVTRSPADIEHDIRAMFRRSATPESIAALTNILAHTKTHGAVVWAPPDHGNLFNACLKHTLPTWLRQAGVRNIQFDFSAEHTAPDFSTTERVLVCVLHRAVIAGVKLAPYTIGLGTEHGEEVKFIREVDAAFNERRLFLHVSAGLVTHWRENGVSCNWPMLALPHLWWPTSGAGAPWEQHKRARRAGSSHTVALWIHETDRRRRALIDLNEEAMKTSKKAVMYRSVRTTHTDDPDIIRRVGAILNVHAREGINMLEVHRITHPFLRDHVIVSETSCDSELEMLWQEAGVLFETVANGDTVAAHAACSAALHAPTLRWPQNCVDPMRFGFDVLVSPQQIPS